MSAPSVVQRLTNLLFWLALALALGGSVALDLVVAPTIFSTARRLQVQVPDLPAAINAPNHLGGQTFGNVLANFAPVENVCIAMVTVLVILETLLWLKRRSTLVITRLLLLVPLIAATIFFTHAATAVRQGSTDWVNALRQNSPHAAEFRARLDGWHHTSTEVEMIRILSLAAIAALSAWGLPPKPDQSQSTQLTHLTN